MPHSLTDRKDRKHYKTYELEIWNSGSSNDLDVYNKKRFSDIHILKRYSNKDFEIQDGN